jgi:ADP-ribose pyrophosphatase
VPGQPFRRIEQRVLHRNRWIKLVEHQVEVASSGHRFTYTYLSSAPSVMVVAVTPERKVVLVRQYRYPSGKFAYELPGGGTDGRPPRDAALAELRQETGYRASNARRLGEFTVYCGLSDEVCQVYLATGLKAGSPKLEKTEHLTVHEVGFGQLQAMIRRGEFCDGMGLAALAIAEAALRDALGAQG